MKLFVTIAILGLVASGTWLLTGLDKTAGGESKRGRHLTRALRTAGVVVLAAGFSWILESDVGLGAAPFLVIIPMSIAIILRSSISELVAHGFLRLVDPGLGDRRPIDPDGAKRHLDAIAHLIQSGQRDAAIKLCAELKKSGEVEVVTLQHTLEYLGEAPKPTPVSPLVMADGFRAQGKFAAAEDLLKSLLAQNPGDSGAAIMLIRLYAQDLRQPDRAHGVLQAMKKQSRVSADHVEFACRSLAEWSRTVPTDRAARDSSPAESVEELLAQGGVGTAIERLEQEIAHRPAEVELQLKLAEVYAVNCQNLPRAEKIVEALERRPEVQPQQIADARAKLREWRRLAGDGHGAT